MPEKIKLVNDQTFNILKINLEGENLEINFDGDEYAINELDDLFTNKLLIEKIIVLSQADEQSAAYSGYVNYISLTKDNETKEIKVSLGKMNEMQSEIEELKKQVNQINEIVASKL